MKVVHVKRFPPGNYIAINLFGVVFTKEFLSTTELNHERIHTAQMKELLYLPFYVWYVCEWAVLLLRYRNPYKAYRSIRFEREAYAHQHDLNYLRSRRHFRYR